MTYPQNDDLARAREIVTIFALWTRAGLPGVPPTCDGVYKSPFRDERSPSFSISHHGKAWKDFGGAADAKGDAWDFIEACPCWSQLDKQGIAKLMIEVSGITPTPRPPPTNPVAPGAAPAELDPRLVRAAKAIEKRDTARAIENAIYEDRAAQLEIPNVKPAPKWPACVRDHYLEGVAELRSPNRKRTVAELASDRGWPEEWAHALIEQDLVSFPWERWSNSSDKWAKRQKAFAVLAPRFSSGPAAVTTLEPVGYHQRFYVPARGAEPERKGWLYVPSMPKLVAASQLERDILEYAKPLGISIENKAAMVPPVPFVLGDVQAPRLVVLLEGQWDAITFFGACGWFHDKTPPQGVAVFGIRGAQGIDAFIGHWAPWLERVKPRIWIIADNDAAGGSWRDAPPAKPGLPRPPSLAERLEFATDRHGRTRGTTIVSWLKRGPYGKDFNDYFKSRTVAGKPLTVSQMWQWMAKVGVLNSAGGWK